MQPLGLALCSEGICYYRITQQVWYVDELKRMREPSTGGRQSSHEGIECFSGAFAWICAGAALVIAGPREGHNRNQRCHTERGYENMVEKVRGLGGDILSVDVPDSEELSDVG